MAAEGYVSTRNDGDKLMNGKMLRRTEGLCLRRLDYGDTSQVVSFLTPDYGRVDCMFRGVWRQSKKGISTGVDLASRYRLTYRESSSGALDTLFDCTMIEHFSGMRLAVERAICGYYAVELMRSFTAHSQDCAGLYTVMLEKLRGFAAGERLGLGVLGLEIAVLKHQGFCPDFLSCVQCHTTEFGRGFLSFSGLHGGVLCEKCNQSHKAGRTEVAIPIKASVLSFLEAMSRDEDGGFSGKAAPALIVAASRVLRYHISWQLGRELKMWKYLHSRYYSRFLSKIAG